MSTRKTFFKHFFVNPLSIKSILFCTFILGIIAPLITQPFTQVSTVEAKTNTYHMSYIYYGETPELIQKVDATQGALQTLSPSYFELSSNGSLVIADTLDPIFIKAMHDRGIKVVPFLGNEWNRALAEKALQNRESLSAAIVTAMQKYQLDGINVDLENITKSSRDALIDFVKLLRAKLPASKELSIAVPANPDGDTSESEGAYHLTALAASCDYIMLMAYDEHYQGDPEAGPVASLPFVEKSIQFALSQIPSTQLVLGIPFYGRLWNGQPAYDGVGITNALASTLAAKYGGSESYDNHAQSIQSKFTIQPDDPRTVVFGQPLPNGSYTLWFENERSLKAKLELVGKYQLKGTGSWSLNQAAADTWSYYESWANGHYYTDLQNHWSQHEAIEMVNKGWMLGVSSDLFAPEQSLTRAQAATIMSRVLANSKWVAPAATITRSSGFSDVTEKYWAYNAILSMSKLGIIMGISHQRFAPDTPLTREQVSVLLLRLLNLQPSTNSVTPFSDVTTNRWSFSAIAALTENHILAGFKDGSFHPKEQVSRAQMAAILFRIQDRLAY